MRNLSLLLMLLFACTTTTQPKKATASPHPGRIIAIGDIHGDPGRTLEALRLAGLVDESGAWVGKDATLVQLGDIADRGDDTKGAYALLRRLQAEAKAAGGQVIVIMGNHEAMNMQGDWRYVSPGDVALYGGREARVAAFKADGEEGRWLMKLPAVAQLGDTVFVHGGLRPEWASKGIEGVNEALRATLRPGAMNTDPTNPLWYRGFVTGPAEQECASLEEALALLGARRMVVGHTRSEGNRIKVRCSGKLLAIDTSLSSFYPEGRVSALELLAGDAKALYTDKTEDLLDP